MSTSVTMPALGESVTEGTVTRWLKQEGDQVDADEPLLEVSTDKVDTEIPSPASGVLPAIVVGEDETVAVGAELAVIGDAGEGGGGQQDAASRAGSRPQHGAEQASGAARRRSSRRSGDQEQAAAAAGQQPPSSPRQPRRAARSSRPLPRRRRRPAAAAAAPR